MDGEKKNFLNHQTMSKKTLTPEDEILKAVEAYHQRKKAKNQSS
jgi:hypothetical protein